MKGSTRFIIKALAYVMFVWPISGSIFMSILGRGFGNTIGFLVAAGLALWLERTGKSNQIIDKVYIKIKGAPIVKELHGVETTMICPQCGAVVTLYGGHGKCDSCDNAY